MTAGSISAPAIIPLYIKRDNKNNTRKFKVDTDTEIEISSETPNVIIYYTTDGTTPDPMTTIATRRSTIQYKKPFHMPMPDRKHDGKEKKVTIKAIAVAK